MEIFRRVIVRSSKVTFRARVKTLLREKNAKLFLDDLPHTEMRILEDAAHDTGGLHRKKKKKKKEYAGLL